MKTFISTLLALSLICGFGVRSLADLSISAPGFQKPVDISSVVLLPKKTTPRKPRSKLIEWAKTKWVDINAKGGGKSGSGTGDGDSTGNGMNSGGDSGNGSGKSLGKNSAANTGNYRFNEDAQKNGAAVPSAPRDKDSGGGNKPPPPPSGDGDAIAYPKFYPMCLFVDSHVTNDVNAAIKGQTEMAAKCGVNLVIFPMTVQSNYPADPNTINQLTQANCNINEKFKVAGSSVSICGQHVDSPARMCDAWKDKSKDEPDLNVAGCAQVQAAGGGAVDDKTLQQGAGGSKMVKFSGGGSAPSIERPDACTAGIVAHESQGHSQFGQPNGSKDGNGIGEVDPTDPPGGAEGSGSFNGWTGSGCLHMQQNSFANDGRWKYNPKRQNYFKMEMDPQRQWDLRAGRKLFGDPGGPPGTPDSAPPMMAGPDSGPSDPKKSPPGMGNDGATPDRRTPSGQADQVASSAPDSKHKKKPGGPTAQDVVDMTLANSTTSTPPSIPNLDDKPLNDPKLLPPVASQNSFSGNQGSTRYEFNENNAKNTSGESGISNSPSQSSGAPSAGGGASYQFNENASKNDGSGSISLSAGDMGSPVGRSGGGVVTVSGGANVSRDPASEDTEKDQKKKRPEDRSRRGKGKRESGGSLRKGKTNLINIYQSGGGLGD